jgi:beta-galactosidase
VDIPPFGYEVDYLTFGGIYREVSLRIVSPTYLENIFAQPKDVLSDHPSVDVRCFLAGDQKTASGGFTLEAALYDGDKLVAKTTQPVPALGDDGASQCTLHLDNLGAIERWDLKTPKLYRIEARLLSSGHVIDHDARRIGFREARFTPQGFSLNGTIVKLRGLDRHQTFPWVG